MNDQLGLFGDRPRFTIGEDLPSDWGLPHDSWRPGSFEAVQWALNSHGHFLLLQAPTGSGKSGIATAISQFKDKVVVLTYSKNLQHQYEDIYGWPLLMGKNNYPCVHDYALADATAEDCFYEGEMSSCEARMECPYANAFWDAIASPRVCMNYALWLSIRNIIKKMKLKYDLVVCDEAHLLPDLVLDWVGIQLTMERVFNHELPMIPKIPWDPNPIGRESPQSLAHDWFQECLLVLQDRLNRTKGNRSQDLIVKRKANRMKIKLECVDQALTDNPSLWYINSGPLACDGRPGLVVKPLTARLHFPGYFHEATVRQVLMMSATIGNPQVLSKELGITDYDYHVMPNQWPPESRPVYVIKGMPHMGNTSAKADAGIFETQADYIAKFIQSYPDDWDGLILVTRKTEAKLLADRLTKRGLGRRVFPAPEASTIEQARIWEDRKKKVKGSLLITWNFWEGFDGIEEKMLVVTKVPFPRLGGVGTYERARTEHDKEFYRLQAGLTLEQGCGRVRRGIPGHYNSDGVERKAVLVADASVGMIKGVMSDGFKESITEWRGIT